MGSTIVLCTEGGAAENVQELLNSKYMNKYSGFFCYALFISIYFSRPSPGSDFWCLHLSITQNYKIHVHKYSVSVVFYILKTG